MDKRIKGVGAVVGVVLLGGMVAACKPHGSHGDHAQKAREHFESSLKKVGATDEQRTRIGVVTDQIVADGQQISKNGKGVSAKVAGCLLLDNPNREWLHKTVDEKALEFTGFAHRTVDRLIEISAMLTPEQRAKLKKGVESGHGEK
ncbi:MAG: hypothetical protein A2075_16415 [Geobacteraceae bacterium GWC2_58_44]|nr:MAG: hypothetical protein A2075_16415 [Geobacteraceae bacterium GWC2_58_44]HBG05976.1 hypothetical protein [Geobacter sp.]